MKTFRKHDVRLHSNDTPYHIFLNKQKKLKKLKDKNSVWKE